MVWDDLGCSDNNKTIIEKRIENMFQFNLLEIIGNTVGGGYRAGAV